MSRLAFIAELYGPGKCPNAPLPMESQYTVGESPGSGPERFTLNSWADKERREGVTAFL